MQGLGPAAGIVLPLLAATILSAAITVTGWHNRGRPGGLRLAVLMGAAGTWAGFYALELLSFTLPMKTLWAQLEYLGIATIPVAWLLFALDYSGTAKSLSRRHILMLATLPTVTFIIALTNGTHHLLWSEVRLDTSGSFPHLVIEHGPWFWVHLVFSYVLLSAGTLLLLWTLFRYPRRYRLQAALLLLATAAPWVSNALFVFGAGPAANVDLTPFAFVFTGVVLAFDIGRLRLLRSLPAVLPVARNQILQTMQDGVLVLDVDGAIVMANEAGRSMLGLSEDQTKRHPRVHDLGLPASLYDESDPATDRHIELVLGQNGTQRSLDGVCSPLSLRGRIGMGRLIVLRDVSERKEAENVLRESESRYRSLFDNAHDLIFSLDLRGKFLSVNDAMAKACGYSVEEFGALWLSDVMAEQELQRVKRLFTKKLAKSERALFETELLARDGRKINLEASVHNLKRDGQTVAVQCLCRDVTEQRLWEEALRHQALHDGTTSLPNRTFFRERLHQVVMAPSARARRHALLILDLDGFKEINDTFGHHCGDALLRQVAYRLQKTMRTADMVARLGGDEFAVLIPVEDTAAGCRAALRVLDALLPNYEVEDQVLRLSASVGVAIFPENGTDADTLLRYADIAMYTAKRAGGGRYATYSADRDHHDPDQLSMNCELRAALERDELMLYYQPMISCDDGSVHAMEALARWAHPRRGLILPAQFIGLAEQDGLIGRLTTWALTAALDQCAQWRAQNRPARVSVNLSARDLENPDLASTIMRLIQGLGADPSWLSVELTESSIMLDPSRTRESLMSLKELGISIAIDDFGAGHTSLGYLKRLPVDILKIDKSFVMNMTIDRDDAAIVRSTIGLAHDLDLIVVAEGVENVATLRLLKAFGCDIVQGNHLGRPMPAKAAGTRLPQSGAATPGRNFLQEAAELEVG